jgi:hypothetical protein
MKSRFIYAARIGSGELVDAKGFSVDDVHKIGPKLILDIGIIYLHVEQIPVTSE